MNKLNYKWLDNWNINGKWTKINVSEGMSVWGLQGWVMNPEKNNKNIYGWYKQIYTEHATL